MGKSRGEHPKAAEAAARKEAAERNNEARREQEAEDAYWREAGDGSKSKAQHKKDQKDAERAASAMAKAESRRIAALEEAEMNEYGKKKEKEGRNSKMTQHELRLLQDRQQREAEKARIATQKMQARETSEEEYMKMVDVENRNRETDNIDASGIDAAVKAMSEVGPMSGPDAHPEKRVRGAYKAYEREQLSTVMSQYPGLTLSQYKEKLWKSFLKSETNPMNA